VRFAYPVSGVRLSRGAARAVARRMASPAEKYERDDRHKRTPQSNVLCVVVGGGGGGTTYTHTQYASGSDVHIHVSVVVITKRETLINNNYVIIVIVFTPARPGGAEFFSTCVRTCVVRRGPEGRDGTVKTE